MNRFTLLGAAALTAAVIVHYTVVGAVPRAVMGVAMSRIAGAEGANVMKDAPPATAEARTVVRPSPDLAYSACVLDLERGAVHLSIRESEPYTSLSLFSAVTDNYFTEDDRMRDGPIEVVVVAPGAPVPAQLPENAHVVEAPTVRGMAIVRRIVEEKASLSAIEAARKRSFCVPYPG